MSQNITWVIGSTGSDTTGTTISTEITNYLIDNGFERAFAGNPTYITSNEFSEQEMRKIAKGILDIRNTGNKIAQNVVRYWKVEKSYILEN